MSSKHITERGHISSTSTYRLSRVVIRLGFHTIVRGLLIYRSCSLVCLRCSAIHLRAVSKIAGYKDVLTFGSCAEASSAARVAWCTSACREAAPLILNSSSSAILYGLLATAAFRDDNAAGH